MTRTCARGLAVPEPLEGNYFVSSYPPFSCWTASATAAVRRQLARPAPDDAPPLGLYVHIPFCVERCDYCYYFSSDERLAEMDRYLQALARELELYAETPYFAGRPVRFVYFGGGTPSLLSTTRVRRLLGSLQRIVPWDDVREVTFECAPKSVTPEKLLALRDGGITRLSLGVQQLDDEILRANGRIHTVADAERAYEAIRRVGFDVVNLDLIAGLVGESDETFFTSLERVVDWAPESVTVYQLEIPLNTPLWRSIRAGALTAELPDWETKHTRLRRAMDRLEEAGYTVSSAYAALEDPSDHEFAYQVEQYRGADLLGIGASSFSYLGACHQQNESSLSSYLDRVERGEPPLARAHLSTPEECWLREFVLQLKLLRVESARFERKFGVDVVSALSEPLAELVEAGWLRIDDGGIRVTREGLPRVDRMIPSFYLPRHSGVRYT